MTLYFVSIIDHETVNADEIHAQGRNEPDSSS